MLAHRDLGFGCGGKRRGLGVAGAIASEGRRAILSGHRGDHHKVDPTLVPLLPGQRAIRVACRPCAWDAQESRSGIELEAHLRVEVVEDRKEQVVPGY